MPTNWGWWVFSVVFLSVVLGIAANFLSRPLMKRYDKWSADRRIKARKKDKKQQEKFERDVQLLLSDQFYVLACIRSIEYEHRERSASYLIVMVACVGMTLLAALGSGTNQFFGTVLLGTVAAYFFIFSRWHNKNRKRDLDILNEYERRKFGNSTDHESGE